MQPYIRQAKQASATTLAAIAEALTACGIATPSGRGAWHPATVRPMREAAQQLQCRRR